MRVAILTDSSWGGKASDYRDLFVVPLLVTDENNVEIKTEQLSESDLKTLLAQKNLKTSLTPPGVMLAKWDELLKHYDQIVFAGLSKGLSGQFNTYRMISETDPKYRGKVFVVDTNGVSVVLEKQIGMIAWWISRNKNGFEILELINKHNEDFTGFIIPRDLEALKRGGRITPAAAALAKMFKIIPILRYNGVIDKEGTVRTYKRAVHEALDLIKRKFSTIDTIDFAHSMLEEEDEQMIRDAIRKHGFKIRLDRRLPPVIATHTGPGTIALIGWHAEGGNK